jgi:uroporphyrinogen-III decarboxylase
MKLDLFETLSPPPVSNVDLRHARKVLDDRICTRGNIGLDVLLTGTPEDVHRHTQDILEATQGTKHMVAASDYLFYDIPLENVKAIVHTVESYN